MSILEKAKAVQGKRKKRYGDADKKRNSKIRRKPTEKNLEVWSRNPGRSDIIGVDGEGTPTLKRDQEPTPRPKRKKAAPKRKKAEVKAQPKPQPKAGNKILDYPDNAITYAIAPGLTGVVNGPDLSDWANVNPRTILKVKGAGIGEIGRTYVNFTVSPEKGQYQFKGPGPYLNKPEVKLYSVRSNAMKYMVKRIEEWIYELQSKRAYRREKPAQIEFLQSVKPNEFVYAGYRPWTEKEIDESSGKISRTYGLNEKDKENLRAYLKNEEDKKKPAPDLSPEKEAELTKESNARLVAQAKEKRKGVIEQRKRIKGRDAGLEAKISLERDIIDRFSEKKKKKEESNEVGGFTLRKWVPGSNDSEAYQIYEGEVGNLKLVGLLFKRKADKYERDGFYVRRDPWGYMLYEQGQIIYTSSVYDGFKTKEKAIFGLKNRIGFSMIHRFWENVTNSYKQNAGKARDLRIEAEAYRVLTEKDGARTLSMGYGNWKGTHSMGYLYSKGYVIPIPSGWQIGTPDMKNFDLKKGSKFDKWENPASQVNALNEKGEWWAEKGQGRAVSDLQEIAKQYGMSKSYNFAELGEFKSKRLKDILPISIDEAKLRDEYWEALFNIKGVSNRFRNYWNLFVEIAEDEVPLKNASDAMRDLTYRDYDEAGGRRRKMYLTDISRAETDALEILLQRNNLGRVSQEQIEFIFKDDGLTAYMYRMRSKLFQLLNSVFAGLSRQASSAYTGGGNFPVRRMQKIQEQNEKKERLLLEEVKKYESVLKSYFKGTKYEEKQELEQRRERAEELGLKSVRKEVDLGVWEYDPGTSRLNFEPAQMLEPDMRTKLRRSPYAMKWSPRFKQYTRVVSLGSVPTVGLRNALKRDFDFDLPLPIDAKAAAAPKADNPESIVDNLSAEDRSKVSMKIDELAKLADEAKAKGEAAPNYNLCEVTIPGTNIYCEGNKGIERAKMPQFKGTPVPGSPASNLPKDSKGEVDTEPIFRKQLKEEGIAITPKEIYSDNLKATQSELVGAKVAGMTKALEANPNNPGITAPIFVSNDNYVIDGHHRWAAVTSYAIKNGLPKKMKVEVIDLPIEEAIKKSNDFADMIGIAQKAAKTEEKKEAPKKAADDSPMDAMLQDALGLNVTWAERKAELMKLAKKYEEASGPARKDIERLYSNLLERTTQNAAGSEPSSDAVCGAMIVQLQIFPNVMRKLRSSVEVSPQFYPYGFNLVTGGMIPNNYLSNSPLWKYMDDLYQSVMYDIKPLKKSKYKLQTQSLGARNMDIAKGKLGKWKDNLKLAVPYLKPYFGKDTLRPAMMSAYVDSFGFTATNAFKLIHLDAENTDWPLSESGSGIYPAPTANNDFGDRIEVKYPNWKAVVPSTTAEEVIYVQGTNLERLYKFVMMQTDYQMFLPIKDVYNIFFKTENGFTAFNTALLVEVIKTIYKLGQSSVTVLYYGETRPSLWVPGTFNSKVVDAERNTYILLMPVLSENLAPRFGSKSKRVLRDGGYIEDEDSEYYINIESSSDSVQLGPFDTLDEASEIFRSLSYYDIESYEIKGKAFANIEREINGDLTKIDQRQIDTKSDNLYSYTYKLEQLVGQKLGVKFVMGYGRYNGPKTSATIRIKDHSHNPMNVGDDEVIYSYVVNYSDPTKGKFGTNDVFINPEKTDLQSAVKMIVEDVKGVRKLARGGYVHGPSHAHGGVDMPVKSTGQMVELEGGEGVVNKRSMASNKSVTLNGKRMKPCQAVSQINQMDGNGVPIQC